jgi:hypothetical protein
MKRLTNLLMVALVCIVASPALAQEDVRARSLELNEAGFEAFEHGRFAEAATLFSNAYDLVPDPALRKNEAVAWFKAKRCDDAISAANKLLLLEGATESDRAEVRTIIANCKVEFARDALDADEVDVAREFLAEAEALASDDHVIDQIKVVRLEIARKEKADTRPAPETSPDESPEPPDATASAAVPPEPSPTPVPTWKWVVLGSGGAVMVSGLVLHLAALGWQSRFLEMADHGGDPDEFDGLRRRVHTARVLVPVMYSLGAIGAGAGAALIFVLPSMERGLATAPRVGLKLAIRF